MSESIIQSLLNLLFKNCFFESLFVFERERERKKEREDRAGKGQRGTETQNLQHAPGSELSAQLTQDHDLNQSQLLNH